MRFFTFFTSITLFLGFAAATLSEDNTKAVTSEEEDRIIGRYSRRLSPSHLVRRGDCDNNFVPNSNTQYYTVQLGDTLTTIGEKLKRGLCVIAKINNITDINSIFPGQIYAIPPASCPLDNTSCVENYPVTRTCVDGGPGFYVVQLNDTLTSIAGSLNITLESFQAANKGRYDNPDNIKEGLTLSVPVCDSTICSISPYRARLGDTFFKLARTFESTTGQLRTVNLGVEPNKIQIGQLLTLVSYCHQFPGLEPPTNPTNPTNPINH